MYMKCFDTVMFYYVILVILVNVTFCHFQISRRSVPRTSRRSQRDGTQMTDASIPRITLQEGHRGSAGQGK
ncbi:unnamed protein product [Staurois parvus]|uniref:Secreted protein n=1 Tax=Staurois parvus TaxID=386267 RepID=A0ABN9E6N2_9NEOB|nr:unnamed protein product [Staurois parvus]